MQAVFVAVGLKERYATLIGIVLPLVKVKEGIP